MNDGGLVKPWVYVLTGAFVVVSAWNVFTWIELAPGGCRNFQDNPGKWTMDAWNKMRLCAGERVSFFSTQYPGLDVAWFENMNPTLSFVLCADTPKNKIRDHDVILCKLRGNKYTLIVADNQRTQALSEGVELSLYVSRKQ